jgi:mRNA interferase MazF
VGEALGLKRGEIWTIAGGPDYAGKPRPSIIVQSDKFDATLSITVCPLTGTLVDAAPARFIVAPSGRNGLQIASQAMVDKISTVLKTKLGRRIGALEPRDIAQLNRALALFLGLADAQD